MLKKSVLVLGIALSSLLASAPAHAVKDTCTDAVAVYTANGYTCEMQTRGQVIFYRCTGNGYEFDLFPYPSGCVSSS